MSTIKINRAQRSDLVELHCSSGCESCLQLVALSHK
jgi:hypothetical protein